MTDMLADSELTSDNWPLNLAVQPASQYTKQIVGIELKLGDKQLESETYIYVATAVHWAAVDW